MEWFWGKPKRDGVYLFGGTSAEQGAVWRGMELLHLLSGWYGQIVDRPE